jgi:hypothetical protein
MVPDERPVRPVCFHKTEINAATAPAWASKNSPSVEALATYNIEVGT